MDETVDTLVISSFKEYLNHKIISDLTAFTNRTVTLYNYSNPPRNQELMNIYGMWYSGFYGVYYPYWYYGSPYASWIYDTSINGVQVPSGVGSGTGFIPRGSSGLVIDFKNGRLLLESGVISTAATIDVSIPDFNIYVTSKDWNSLLFEKNFEKNPTQFPANTYVAPDSVIAPCIFIKFESTENHPFTLGGLDETEWRIKIIVVSDNLKKLYGVAKIIRDINYECFSILDQSPLTELNDLKESPWNYTDFQSSTVLQNNLLFINDSSFKVLDIDFLSERHPELYFGMGSVAVSKFRLPREDSDIIYNIPQIYEFN